MPLRYIGLPASPFADLFALSDAELATRGCTRHRAVRNPGYPCRFGLREAAAGETVILLNYCHQSACSPYQATGPIFVGENDRETYDRIDEMPDILAVRLLSLRADDDRGTMLDADVVAGAKAAPVIERLLAVPDTAYLHAHFASRGCYACRIERA